MPLQEALIGPVPQTVSTPMNKLLLIAAVLFAWHVSQSDAAAATLTVSPAAVSNTYKGAITLQIGGLTNGETVIVQQFQDMNTNGIVDSNDALCLQLPLTDGQLKMVGGATNISVPGDLTPTDGKVTAQLGFLMIGSGLPIPGQFFFRLSSPTGRFGSLTNRFSVTNSPYAQSFTGTVRCSGTNVPHAVVLAFSGEIFESTPVAGAFANSAGVFRLPLPPGTYGLVAGKGDYVASTATGPQVVLNSGAVVTTNLSLLPATRSISGRLHAADNSSFGLPGIFVLAVSPDGVVGLSRTDANGSFRLGATANQCLIDWNDNQLPLYGCLQWEAETQVDASTGSVAGVTVAFPRGTALIYGTIRDAQNKPLPGINFDADDNLDLYHSSGFSDANGNYAAAVLAGTWRVEPETEEAALSSYLFSQAEPVSLSDGQAVRRDFTALFITNRVSGYLKDANNHPLSDVWIWAGATINGTYYQSGADTDATGRFEFAVGDGTWSIGVHCGSENFVGYLCPPNQTVTIARRDAALNFVALATPYTISGYLRDGSGNPLGGIGIWADTGGVSQYSSTDPSGRYSISVGSGTWVVGVNCGDGDSLSSQYLCPEVRTIVISSNSAAADFVALLAPAQISGFVRNSSNNPIANVVVYAYGTIGGSEYNVSGNTDAAGHYTLGVANGTWNVEVNCGGGAGSLDQLGYLCVGQQTVDVTNAAVSVNFITRAAPYQISGSVRDAGNQPLTNVYIGASGTIGGLEYWPYTFTDAQGNYAFLVAGGTWNLSMDCSDLNTRGYLCPDLPAVIVVAGSVVTNIMVQACSPLHIRTTTLPEGQVGSFYDVRLEASSCFESLNWSLSSGSLPPGLKCDGQGQIQGTPTTAGTWNFSVQVEDSGGQATNQFLSLTINPAMPDVLSLHVMKLKAFRQLDATTTILDTNNGPFHAYVGLVQSALGVVQIANVTLPTSAVKALPAGSTGLTLQNHELFADQAALDAVYPAGRYTFSLFTIHDGAQFPALELPAAVYPAAPRISKLAAAQALNPADAFTVQWDAFDGGTANDWIWLMIADHTGAEVFSTPAPSVDPAGSLKGHVTSTVVPANTFRLNQSYTGLLMFVKRASATASAYPGAVGVTLLAVQTSFPLMTPSGRPTLSQPFMGPNQQFAFEVNGFAGQNYIIQYSDNLTNWATLYVTNPPTAAFRILPPESTNSWRFYRVRVGIGLFNEAALGATNFQELLIRP